MTIYLYKKTHIITGMQYLGITTCNPHTYKGSGKNWKKHLKKYGYQVSTKILKECQTREEAHRWGLYYSKLWNVVDSYSWANLVPERGGGINAGRKLFAGRQKVIEKAKEKMARRKNIGKTSSRVLKEVKYRELARQRIKK